MAGLRAFVAIAIYMGMKNQPNYKTYWMTNSFFSCSKIAPIVIRQRLMDLRRCVHITNRREYEDIDRNDAKI